MSVIKNLMLSLAILTLANVQAQSGVFGNGENVLNHHHDWHSVWLDSADKAQFQWSVTDPTRFNFRLTYKSTGYASVGFSLTGSMKGADIFLIYVTPNGRLVAIDCYAKDNAYPLIDDAPSNYNVTSMNFNSTHITVEASRLYVTCDNQDVPITNDTMRVLWALNDGSVANFSTLNKHEARNRGARSIQLMNAQNGDNMQKLIKDSEAQTYDVTVSNVTIPSSHHTLYYCRIVEVPPQKIPTQIVGFNAVINPSENIRFVHHLILYKCKSPASEFVDRSGPCSVGNTDSTQDELIDEEMETIMGECMQQIVTGFVFPDDIGLPLFDDTESTYLMLEMHYDNQNYEEIALDNSGVRMFYTPNLRAREAVHIPIGLPTNPWSIVIPPGEPSFTTSAYCAAECTNMMSAGIEVFAGLLHSHILGRKMRLRHIRNGVELPPIITDEHYDFNYQNIGNLSPSTIVQRGDEMILECVYDSSDRENVTLGGDATTSEMCLAFLYAVPLKRLPLDADGRKQVMLTCQSTNAAPLSAILVERGFEGGKFVSFENADKPSETMITVVMNDKPEQNVTMSLREYYDRFIDWDEITYGVPFRKRFQQIVTESDQWAVCGLHGQQFSYDLKYFKMYGPPRIDKVFELHPTCGREDGTSSYNVVQFRVGKPLMNEGMLGFG